LGRAVRLWQSPRAALAELQRTTESAATPEIEQGSSAAGLENPSQTVWNAKTKKLKFIINNTTITDLLIISSPG